MKNKKQKATFAAGCFWGIEEKFRCTEGVVDTIVGYSGGHTKEPSYENVCEGDTGHAESVQITFDPEVVSYEELLDVFWRIHDPTMLNRQGLDIGSQYKSVIFYHSKEQKEKSEKSKKELENSGKYKERIVTEIKPIEKFYEAEEYHQKYLIKQGKGSCRI